MMTFLLQNFSWSLNYFVNCKQRRKGWDQGTRFLNDVPFCSSFPSPYLHKVMPNEIHYVIVTSKNQTIKASK